MSTLGPHKEIKKLKWLINLVVFKLKRDIYFSGFPVNLSLSLCEFTEISPSVEHLSSPCLTRFCEHATITNQTLLVQYLLNFQNHGNA